MTIPVCNVLVTLTEPSGAAIPRARVTAKLTEPVAYGTVIVPLVEFETTDAQGACTLPLFPNSLGNVATTYSFEILLQGSIRPIYYHGITVPNVASITLSELIGGGGSASVTVWNDAAVWNDSSTWTEA